MSTASILSQYQGEKNPEEVNYLMTKLLVQIFEHLDHEHLIDVRFKLTNPPTLVAAHRLVLSAASPYFRELFRNAKDFCSFVEIGDIDSDTFKSLIAFCYTGKALVTIDNVRRMLEAALILQLEDAVTNCVAFLIEHINEYTLQRLYALEKGIQCEILKKKILEYEIDNFMWLIQTDEFLYFEVNKLQKILESDVLNAPDEKDVFIAVKRWYEFDISAREQQLVGLISRLRLTQLDTEFILAYIQPLPGCQLLAWEVVTWINHHWARSSLSIKYIKPRKRHTAISSLAQKSLRNEATRIHSRYNDRNNNSIELEESFLAFNIEGGTSNAIFQYDKAEDLWQKWVDIEIDDEVTEFRAIYMDGNLIFIGGLRNNKTINEVNSWNLETKTFKELPSMKHARYLHCVVTLNDRIYVIGGWGGTQNQILQSMEMYSASKGWKQMKGMITARYNASAVVLNGKIYVMGGYNERELNSVECYDPTTNCWTQCVDMREVHNTAGATVHNGQIFVLGGCNQLENSPTVERCADPQENEWTKIRSFKNGRWGFGCISIYKQLWTVGGYTHDYTNSVSVYDERNRKWIAKNPIPIAGHYYCFAVPKTLIQSEEPI